ncbi:MAG: MBL fold metallo-hydrolase [Desulfobacteraceae bacterium]|nr:MAG: MBL fold metallo-hydrolase [Desulfobacteraceae bacterium]
MIFGDMELIPITDGTSWGDGGGAFGLVPKTVWDELLPSDSRNRIPMILRCLLVRTPQATILVETGMGDKVTPEIAEKQHMRLERPNGWLLDDLRRHDVAPDDVDIVLLTHLHGDHSGGGTRFLDGQIVPTFPRAHYLVQQREWRDAHNLNERTRATYFGINYDPIEKAGKLKLLDGDAAVIPGVRLVTAPGHTAGLQVVIFESGGQTAVFLGDLAFFHWQLERLAWVSAYDVDPLGSIETKRIWQPWLAEREALIIFQHDPLITAGKLVSREGRYKVETVAPAG